MDEAVSPHAELSWVEMFGEQRCGIAPALGENSLDR